MSKCYRIINDKIYFNHFLHYPYDKEGIDFHINISVMEEMERIMKKEQEKEFSEQLKKEREERREKLLNRYEDEMDKWLVLQKDRCTSEFGEFNYTKNVPWFPKKIPPETSIMPDNILIHYYKVYNPCLAHKHDIEVVTRRKNLHGLFSLEYCAQCNKYYVPEALLDKFKDLFHISYPNISYKYYDYMEPRIPGEFKETSILSLHGYHVGQNGLSDERRHEIISLILDSDQAKKYELSSLIQSFISLREHNYKNFRSSIADWKNDLEFISQYRIDEQRFI